MSIKVLLFIDAWQDKFMMWCDIQFIWIDFQVWKAINYGSWIQD